MLLTGRTVEALVAALRRKDKSATVFAIEAKGSWSGQDRIVVDGRPARVREARCALRLREVFHEARGGEDLVILTDLDAKAFGRENLAKVALRRIEPVQPWPVVRTLFGVASIDPALVRHAWMAERLLQAPPADRNIAGGTLDLETAWGIVLGCFGLPSARPTEEEFLIAASKPAFLLAFQQLPVEGRAELKRVIQESLDRFGVTVLAVVERGFGDQVLAAGLVAHCLWESEDPGALQARGAFAERFGVRGLDRAIALRWSSCVQKLISGKADAVAPSRVRAQADSLLATDLGAAELAYVSDELPSGLSQRIGRVAGCVERALGWTSAGQELADLRDAVRLVRKHAMSAAHGEADRAEMAARLVSWLAEPREDPRTLEAAIRRYADEDCWVDRARVGLRDGESVPEARRAYQSLLQRVASERAKLNASVAVRAAVTSLPEGTLIGVEHVLDKVVAPLAAARPVALIVMDGMSHAVALELVGSLEDLAWARYRPKSFSAAPLVLSTVPTVTEFARTSLLCGALKAGAQGEERQGLAAFLRAKGLGGSAAPLLFHKDRLDEDSSTVEEALQSNAKVVACVINAIDAQLDGSDQLRAQWSVRGIPVFSRLVRACEASGRAIVLVSDHGHLVDESTVQLSGHGAGDLRPASRWRGTDGSVRPGELEARGPRVLVPGGACVVAADERVRYGGRHAGYHGGVTVQELACPLHLLVHTGSDEGLTDWVPLDFSVPRWWRFDLESGDPAPRTNTVPRPRTRQRAEAVGETGLFVPVSGSWLEGLFASEVYKAQRSNAGRAQLSDAQVKQIIDSMLGQGQGGAAPAKITEQALASRLELSISDTRRRVTLLRNLLNVDGYEVLSQSDRDSLALDVELLKTQFAIGGQSS